MGTVLVMFAASANHVPLARAMRTQLLAQQPAGPADLLQWSCTFLAPGQLLSLL